MITNDIIWTFKIVSLWILNWQFCLINIEQLLTWLLWCFDTTWNLGYACIQWNRLTLSNFAVHLQFKGVFVKQGGFITDHAVASHAGYVL